MIYTNTNSLYGYGAYDEPDYKTIEDLLDDMDRLDVHLSVTAHAEGRDLNTLYGNRRLMQDLARCPKARGRILPS